MLHELYAAVTKISAERGEGYQENNKDWIWSKLHWEMYFDVARLLNEDYSCINGYLQSRGLRFA